MHYKLWFKRFETYYLTYSIYNYGTKCECTSIISRCSQVLSTSVVQKSMVKINTTRTNFYSTVYSLKFNDKNLH